MKGMADALRDLDCPVSERNLVLQILRGLNSNFDLLKTLIPRQRPFPDYDRVLDDLRYDEIMRGLAPDSPAPSASTVLVAGPPSSAPPPAASLVAPPPSGPSGGGGSQPPSPWWTWWRGCWWS